MTNRVRNTNDDSEMLLLLAEAMGSRNPSDAILAQEARGQRQIVASDVLPTDLGYQTQADYEALGITFGEPVEGDPIFRHATLPTGWKREASDHAMWSYIVDEQGKRRIAVFYKAASYDRSAFMRIEKEST